MTSGPGLYNLIRQWDLAKASRELVEATPAFEKGCDWLMLALRKAS